MPWRVKKNIRDDEDVRSTVLITFYEQLRDYVTSPCRTLSTPLGLDLWIKKGFRGWMKILAGYKSDCMDKGTVCRPLSGADLQHGTAPEGTARELTYLITNMILNRG